MAQIAPENFKNLQMEEQPKNEEKEDVTLSAVEGPKKILHRASLYSTWKQVPAQGAITYFVVWHVKIKDGAPYEYELLRLFSPEFSTISVSAFSTMVEAGKIKEWKM